MANNYKFSQDYELIPPQKQRSYPISTQEWELIKNKIDSINSNINFWHTLGSILIGAALSALIAALINDFQTEKLLWTCWSAVFVFGVGGGLSFYFGMEQRKSLAKTKEDVIDFMKIIEERFSTEDIEDNQNKEIQKQIEIHSAKYGADDKFIDLKEKITDLIEKGITEIKASNDIGGDPIHGKVKNLSVYYTINGQRKQVTIKEGEILNLNNASH